jgi:hypothetical protein
MADKQPFSTRRSYITAAASNREYVHGEFPNIVAARNAGYVSLPPSFYFGICSNVL